MAEAMGAQAKAAAVAARSIAPVATGDYRNSIEGESGVEGGKAIGRVSARDFKSGWIEFGTSKWAAHAVLRRAIDAIGLRMTGGRGA